MMEENKLVALLITFAIVFAFLFFKGLRTFGGNIFFTVYSPTIVTITPTLSGNIYVASVTWIKFEPRWPSGDLYPYSFKIEGIKTEYLKDNYCYLNVSRIISHGEYGAYCAWEIKAKSGGDIIIRAPLINNVCDFYNNGELVNIDDLIYHLVCTYPNDGTVAYTYACKDVGCWDKIKVQSDTISGKLYLLLKEPPPPQAPPFQWLLQIFQAIINFFLNLFR